MISGSGSTREKTIEIKDRDRAILETTEHFGKTDHLEETDRLGKDRTF